MSTIEVVSYINSSFRDHGVQFREIEHDPEARIARVPIVAPDPERTTCTRFLGVLSRRTERFVRWWIEIRCVDDLAINLTEPVAHLTQIELGSIELFPPGRVVIHGQYVLSIEVECTNLDVRLSHEEFVLFKESKIRIVQF